MAQTCFTLAKQPSYFDDVTNDTLLQLANSSRALSQKAGLRNRFSRRPESLIFRCARSHCHGTQTRFKALESRSRSWTYVSQLFITLKRPQRFVVSGQCPLFIVNECYQFF